MSARTKSLSSADTVPGRYSFRTPAEARDLAARLARMAPKPTAVETGLFELFMNAVEHGNLAVGTEEKHKALEEDRLAAVIEARLREAPYRDRLVRVDVTQSETELSFTICDEGAGFDWRTFESAAPGGLDQQYGRGILIARRIAFDRVSYVGSGNCVVATVFL